MATPKAGAKPEFSFNKLASAKLERLLNKLLLLVKKLADYFWCYISGAGNPFNYLAKWVGC
jgi:hypothetical protein